MAERPTRIHMSKCHWKGMKIYKTKNNQQQQQQQYVNVWYILALWSWIKVHSSLFIIRAE